MPVRFANFAANVDFPQRGSPMMTVITEAPCYIVSVLASLLTTEDVAHEE